MSLHITGINILRIFDSAFNFSQILSMVAYIEQELLIML